MFLLDTNVVSHASKKKQDPVIKHWFESQVTLAIPFPVILEIRRGIISVGKTHPHRAAELEAWLEAILQTDFFYPTVTAEVADVLAEMYCCGPLKNLWYMGKENPTAPGQDLFIAAIAITHRLPIATLDWHDYLLIDTYFPLPGLYNPATEAWSRSETKPMSVAVSRRAAANG